MEEDKIQKQLAWLAWKITGGWETKAIRVIRQLEITEDALDSLLYDSPDDRQIQEIQSRLSNLRARLWDASRDVFRPFPSDG